MPLSVVAGIVTSCVDDATVICSADSEHDLVHDIDYYIAVFVHYYAKNSLLLEVPKKGINVRSFSFAERSVKYWNTLSDSEVMYPSLQSFKSRLQNVNLDTLCLVCDF